jgi:GntR family transcriptional regulator
MLNSTRALPEQTQVMLLYIAKPIYMQIVEQMIDQIVTEKIKAGELLPSIRTLAKDLKISVITTKRAYEELEREGYIETVVGKGTFVSGINREFIKERQMEIIELELSNIIDSVKRINLTKDEFYQIINLLWED